MSSATPPPCDWQTDRSKIKERGEYLLKNGLWSDCRFIVGIEPHQQIFLAHKLFLAMSSPVFEAMFYGGMAEKKDPIAILDVQPDAFRALLEYIYTDHINLTSFDQACELCYGAKKYMLPHLVEECTKYLWTDLYPKNACRAYEFAKLFEEPVLMERCLTIISNQTQEVLLNSSFEDVELSTILTVFDQDELNINSELDLFSAITRYANRQNQTTGAKLPRLDGIVDNSTNENSRRHPTLRDALMKIRFLTLSAQEFAEGPATSDILSESEKFAILMNISSSSTTVPMPSGFSTARVRRLQNRIGLPFHPMYGGSSSMDNSHSSVSHLFNHNTNVFAFNEENGNESSKKLICRRIPIRLTECMNTGVLDCILTFTCDKNICVYGVQVPAQYSVENEARQNISYTELLYAHLLDSDGSRLTYTHFTSKVTCGSLVDLSFNRPVYIQKNKVYRVGVVLHKAGLYPIGSYPSQAMSTGVVFTFGLGESADSVRDGLIRSIMFSMPHTNQNVNPAHGAYSISNVPS